MGIVFRLTFVLAAMIFGQSPAALAASLVHLPQGNVAGITDATGVESFKGLPYAAAPVGAFRWRAPGPPPGWSGIRSASAFSRDCIQEPQTHPPGPGFNNPTSEDCLYLNIWRPVHRDPKPLPVMVWIYGGAYIMGGGSFPSYDGAAFAREGVILVTFNYRLGRFGFFAHPALTAESSASPTGNFGLLDQIAALRWVHENIADFGGDPANVTIFGEFAGAGCVNVLMTSPMARGLFAKAISESGSAGNALPGLAEAEGAGKAWADKMEAYDPAALRALSADRVWDGPVHAPAKPILDGTVIVENTASAFAKGHMAHLPYIVGFNSGEESLLRWLPHVEEQWLTSLGDDGLSLLRVYTDEGQPRELALKRLWGEAVFAAPSRARARAIADHGGKAWLYRYAYVPEAAQKQVTSAGHDAEIEMVFKNRDLRWPAPWSGADKAMAEMVNAYWVNFAKTGSPEGPGLPPWMPYDRKNDALMSFSATGVSMISGFGKARFDAIDAALSGSANH